MLKMARFLLAEFVRIILVLVFCIGILLPVFVLMLPVMFVEWIFRKN